MAYKCQKKKNSSVTYLAPQSNTIVLTKSYLQLDIECQYKNSSATYHPPCSRTPDPSPDHDDGENDAFNEQSKKYM